MRTGLLLLLCALTAPAAAQDLPEGHPPTGDMPEGHPPTGMMPEGHPPTGEMPEGHPPTGMMPEGHPPTGMMPEGHPPTGDMPEGHPPTGDMPEGHPPTGDMPDGHPPTGDAAGAGHSHGGMDIGSLFRPPDVASDASDPSLPAGTIRVEVVDENDAAVANAEVELGTMSGGRAAARRPATTDENGIALYEGLVAGSGTAYRVYVSHDGARYGSAPIVLMPEAGHRVRIRRLPVSHDDRQVLQFVAQTIVEIRDDRLHVVIQAQLVNAGDATYVFPPGGLRVPLPEGFLAFNSPPAMNEIEITEVEGYGVAFNGSLPPGLVTTAYGFDLPYSPGLGLSSEGAEAEIAIGNPFRTMRYRIISDAPEGLTLDADGFPAPQEFESDGRALLGTELMRRPGDAPLEEIRFTLRGLPSPGPTRWLAVALGLAVLGIGVVVGRRDRRDESAARIRQALEEREAELLERAAELKRQRADGEIGPETCQSELDAIVHELAGVLARKDQAVGAPSLAPGREPGREPSREPSLEPKNRRKAAPVTKTASPKPTKTKTKKDRSKGKSAET